MILSDITTERLMDAGWYKGRKIDIQDIKELFREREIEIFESAESFLSEFGMLEITFQDPNPAFDMKEYIHFNPKLAVGDCLNNEYFKDLEEEFEEEIGEKIIPVGETDRRNLILLMTPTKKYYGYTDGCLVKFGDNIEEMLECLCIPKVPKIY